MKHKFSLIWRVAVAMVLVLSFSLVAAVPVAAASSGYTIYLQQAGDAHAEWSTAKANSGSYSAKLHAGYAGSDWAEVVLPAPAGITLADMSTITDGPATQDWNWYYYIATGEDSGYGTQLELHFQSATDPDGYAEMTIMDIAYGNPGLGLVPTLDAWTQQKIVGATTTGLIFGTTEAGAAITEWPVGHEDTIANLVTHVTGLDGNAGNWVLVEVRPALGWIPNGETIAYVDDVTIEGTVYDLEPGINFVDAAETTLPTVAADGSFYLYVGSSAWNVSEFAVDSGSVTLKVYDGTPTVVSTTSYTATESGKDTAHFRTDAISGTDLSLRPGYKLEALVGGIVGCTVYARAELSTDKMVYTMDEDMVITLKDDQLNDNPLTPQTVSARVYADLKGDGSGTAVEVKETGNDTGIFTATKTPYTIDTLGADISPWCGDAMIILYQDPLTTAGTTHDDYDASLSGGGSDMNDEITAEPYVSNLSPSAVLFSPATIAVSDTSVDIVVRDRDESSDTAADAAPTETISGAVVVENLTSGGSATIAILTEFSQGGKFKGTVNFGTGTNKFPIHDGDILQATYTDPNDPSDVSTATAAVGSTVFVYDTTDTLKASYTTINAALDCPNITTGWTILVKDTYSPATEAAKVVVDVAGVTIKVEISGTVIDAGAAVSDDTINVIASNVTIEGFTIKNTHTAGYNLINLGHADADSLTVKDCTFDLTVGGADKGIFFSGNAITGVVVDGCTFNVGATATAIESTLNNGVVFDVKNCTFTGSSGIGLNLDDAGTTTAVGVTSNTFDGLKNALVIAESTQTNVELKWNTIKNCTWVTAGSGAIEISDSATVSIVGNDITDNAGYSIWVKDDDTNVDVVFNNITGNAKVLKNGDTDVTKLNAKHNWWGHVTAPTTSDVSSLTYVDTSYYLTALVKLTASYSETDGASFNFKVPTGVKLSANANIDYAGAAEYTETPKAALADASFYDVFLVFVSPAGTDTVTIQFYTPGISADSVVYFWNLLTGSWDQCSNQGYNSYDEYIWVLAKDQTVTVPTYPTIQELTGGMFAISTVPVRTLQSIAVTPATASIGVGGTKQFTATGTYNLAPLTEDITATVTWASSNLSVATIDAAGLATGVAEGTTNITATLGTIVSAPAVLTVEEFDPWIYDEDEDGVISKTEALNAVVDYFNELITKDQALLVIVEYMG